MGYTSNSNYACGDDDLVSGLTNNQKRLFFQQGTSGNVDQGMIKKGKNSQDTAQDMLPCSIPGNRCYSGNEQFLQQAKRLG